MDREAQFDDLFAEHYEGVVHTVFLVLRDRHRAEEIAQDAFTQLVRHWPRVATYDMPEAWVRRVAIRLAVRWVRREQALSAAWRRVAPKESYAPPDGAGRNAVWDAVAQLPVRQRAVVVLVYFEDRSVEEAAQITDCSASTARVHVTRARQRLGELLGEEVTSDVAG